LLALVVEAYSKVRQDIKKIEVEKELITDLVLTTKHVLLSYAQLWPRKSYVIHVLKCTISSRNVSAEHLRLAGVPMQQARRMVAAYALQPELQRKDVLPTLYQVAELGSKGSRGSKESTASTSGPHMADRRSELVKPAVAPSNWTGKGSGSEGQSWEPRNQRALDAQD